MRPLIRGGACIAGALLSAVAVGQGPEGEYYVSTGPEVFVLQGTRVVRSWRTVAGGAETPIAVSDDIRTVGHRFTVGARYSLDGEDLGDRYRLIGAPENIWDATTDGRFNYTIERAVWRYDRDWRDGIALFPVGPDAYYGITFDPSDATLWLSTSRTVEHRAMDGTLLGGFDVPFSHVSCLALDPGDGTLWVGQTLDWGTFHQFTRTGRRLQSITFEALRGKHTTGGEFPLADQRCRYTIRTDARARGGCRACPRRGEVLTLDGPCFRDGDCTRKLKARMRCPDQAPGRCSRIKGRRRACD